DPGVVAWGADHEVTGSELGFFAVVHDDFHAAGDEGAHVGGLAAVGAGDGLDVFGPLPAGLEGGPSDGSAFEVDQLELAGVLFEGTYFFGAVEALLDEAGHRVSFVGVLRRSATGGNEHFARPDEA